eukprot:461926_1
MGFRESFMIIFNAVMCISQEINNTTKLPSAVNTTYDCNATLFCNITCSTLGECHSMEINASLSEILNLNCNGRYACKDIYVSAGPSLEANIYCSSYGACKEAMFNVANTSQEVNMICDETGSLPNPEYSCWNATIIASTANYVDIWCASEACREMEIYVENAGDVDILFGYNAAVNSIIYATNVINILNINCTNRDACTNLDIIANNMQNNQSGLTLNCLTVNSCIDTKIRCPQEDAFCDINCIHPTDACIRPKIFIENNEYDFLDLYCDDDGSCSDVIFTCEDSGNATALEYTSGNIKRLYCPNYNCCPLSWTPLCEAGKHCNLTCTDDNCRDRYIDASKATNLTLYCEEPQSCQHADIQCPNMNGSVCEIICSGEGSCYDTLINAELTADLYVDCEAESSCKNMSLTGGPINKAVFSCLNIWACAFTQFRVPDTHIFDLLCDTKGEYSACRRSTITATNTHSVSIHCMGVIDCQLMKVNASTAQGISVICDDIRSCPDMEINANMAKVLYLGCYDDYSCTYSQINCPYSTTDVCRVECLGMSSCNGMTIKVNTMYNYSPNYLTLNCSSNNCEELTIECNSSSHSTQLAPEYDINYWKCSDFTDCCPYFPEDILQCNEISFDEVGIPDMERCTVDCSQYKCGKSVINGTTFKTLDVHCNNDKECNEMMVRCPEYGSCNVYCNSDDACKKVHIIAGENINYNATVGLICEGNCRDIVLNTKYAKKVFLQCSKTECKNIVINGDSSKHIKILCLMSSETSLRGDGNGNFRNPGCSELEINGKDVEYFELFCEEFNACHNNIFNLRNTQSISMDVSGNYAYKSNYLYASSANYLGLYCRSNFEQPACFNSSYKIPSLATNVHLHCYGTGCMNMGDIYVIDNVTNMQFNVNGCNQCSDISKCINTFQIHCKSSENINEVTTFTGTYCVPPLGAPQVNCGCTNMLSQGVYFSNDESSNECYDNRKITTSFPTPQITILEQVTNSPTILEEATNSPTNSIVEDVHKSGLSSTNIMIIIIVCATLIAIIIGIWLCTRKPKPVTILRQDSSKYKNMTSDESMDLSGNIKNQKSLSQSPKIQVELTDVETNSKKTDTLQTIKTPTDAGDNDIEIQSKEHELIKDWLVQIQLVEYFKNFTEYGYESLEFIAQIKEKQELIDIDIQVEEHQNTFLEEIEKLTNIDVSVKNVTHDKHIPSPYDDPIIETDDTEKKQNDNKTGKYVIEWSTQELLNWILSVEDGRYKIFKDKLSSGFNDEQVNGQNIKDVNEQDLRHYGVNILSDRKDLMKHIQSLVSSPLYQAQVEGENHTDMI